MLTGFFLKLKQAKLPVSIKEYLTLLEAMHKKVIGPSIDDFYFLSRAALVKDEANFDKFDRVFAEYFKGVETLLGTEADIPRANSMRFLTPSPSGSAAMPMTAVWRMVRSSKIARSVVPPPTSISAMPTSFSSSSRTA